MLRWHRGLIAGVSLGCALLGLLIALPQRPVYQAHTSLEVQGPNENFLNMKDLDPASAGGPSSAESYVETQARILQDEALIEKTLLALELDQRQEAIAGPGRVWQLLNAVGLRRAKPAPLSQDELVRLAAENLKVRASSQSRIVDVFFDSTDPQLAADFANRLAEGLIERNLEVHWSAAKRLSAMLNEELRGLKSSLVKSANELQAYARSTGLMFNEERGTTVAEERLRQLQEELSRAQADRVAKQSRYEVAASRSAESLPDVLDYPTLRDYQVKLTELRRQFAELNSAFTSSYPKVKNLQAQIAELESIVQKERNNIVDRLRNEFLAADRREKLDAQHYEEQVKIVSQQAAMAIHYNVLKRGVDSNRALYESIMQKVKEAGVASAIRASSIRVISPAKRPSRPYRPKPLFNASMGLIAGLFLSVAFVFLREHTDRRLKSPGDATTLLNLLELGAIPSATANTLTPLAAPGGMVMEVDPAPKGNRWRSFLRRSQPGGQAPVELASWHNQSSLLAESFRDALATLWFQGDQRVQPRVFVLTSPNAGEGKTTLVSNLGIALASTNRRVLLVSGDIRRPALDRVFGLDNARGLGNILEETDPIPLYPFERLVFSTQVPGLYVLPSGSCSVNITNLDYYNRLTDLFLHLRFEFHTVLVDTPPALQFSDARILGRLSDGVILVIRAEETTREDAAAALRRFQEDGTPVLGAILNDWNPQHFRYGYGYRKYGSYEDAHKQQG